MFSDDVKLVFGFEPSGLFEKIILAPEIGTPRTLAFLGAASVDVSEVEVTDSELVEVAGASFLGVFGTLIFGIVIVNWPIAGTVRNEATAIAAISIRDDDLVM